MFVLLLYFYIFCQKKMIWNYYFFNSIDIRLKLHLWLYFLTTSHIFTTVFLSVLASWWIFFTDLVLPDVLEAVPAVFPVIDAADLTPASATKQQTNYSFLLNNLTCLFNKKPIRKKQKNHSSLTSLPSTWKKIKLQNDFIICCYFFLNM